jgi:ATP-binding cassette subfamily F protein uup
MAFLSQNNNLQDELTEKVFSPQIMKRWKYWSLRKALKPRRRRTYQKLLTEWINTMHGFWNPQANFVQTKVEDFKLKVKTFRVDSKNVCLLSFWSTVLTYWFGWTYESLGFRDDRMVRSLFCQRKHYLIYGNARPFLLERVCNEIIELDNGKLYSTKETTLTI